MNLAFVISDLRIGGAETQVIALSRHLAGLGHRVLVYTLNAHNPRAAELAGSGVELIADQKRSRLDWRVLARLRRTLVRRRVDLVHGFLYDGDFYSRLAAWGTGIPVLNSERNDNYRLKRVQRIGLIGARRLTTAVVANSHAGAQFAQRLWRLPPERVHVVWNGIDLARVDAVLAGVPASAPTSTAGQRICVVGSIKPAKDQILAVETLARLGTPWQLVFVGEDSPEHPRYRPEVEARAQALGMTGRVQWLGGRRDVLQIVRGCDLLLSTSVHEGFPNVVLEAMAVGTPVASTDYSDIRRILPFGWQVAAGRDPAALAANVELVLGRRAEVAAAQRRWVQEHATIEAAGERLLGIYRRCVAGSRGALVGAGAVTTD